MRDARWQREMARFFGGGSRTQSIVLRSKSPRHVRWVDQIHLDHEYAGSIYAD